MGKHANERAWRESRAWEEPEPQEPITNEEWEREYSEWSADKREHTVANAMLRAREV